MNKLKIQEIYRKTIKKNGLRFQFRKLQEECCELGTAVNHMLCNDRKKGEDSFYEEFADVEIMLEQLRPVLDQERLAIVKEYKQKRLRNRLKK